MKKFVLAMSFVLAVACLQAKGTATPTFPWNEADKISTLLNGCTAGPKAKMWKCIGDVLRPVVNKYVDLVNVNPVQAKKVGKELFHISFRNNGSISPLNVEDISLTTLLSRSANVSKISRALYKDYYSPKTGEKTKYNLPWYHFAKHLMCAHDPHSGDCYNGLPALQKV